tara:strand:+ start:249 stop:443 length:195 start_codon:yes stop_codon:yes gene_type:complete
MEHFYDLSSYFTARISALESKVGEQSKEIDRLRTFLFEVTDPECPAMYKDVVRKEIVKEELIID